MIYVGCLGLINRPRMSTYLWENPRNGHVTTVTPHLAVVRVVGL